MLCCKLNRLQAHSRFFTQRSTPTPPTPPTPPTSPETLTTPPTSPGTLTTIVEEVMQAAQAFAQPAPQPVVPLTAVLVEDVAHAVTRLVNSPDVAGAMAIEAISPGIRQAMLQAAVADTTVSPRARHVLSHALVSQRSVLDVIAAILPSAAPPAPQAAGSGSSMSSTN